MAQRPNMAATTPSVETVASVLLTHIVQQACKRAFRMHEYHRLTKNRAVDGRSLCMMSKLVDF